MLGNGSSFGSARGSAQCRVCSQLRPHACAPKGAVLDPPSVLAQAAGSRDPHATSATSSQPVRWVGTSEQKQVPQPSLTHAKENDLPTVLESQQDDVTGKPCPGRGRGASTARPRSPWASAGAGRTCRPVSLGRGAQAELLGCSLGEAAACPLEASLSVMVPNTPVAIEESPRVARTARALPPPRAPTQGTHTAFAWARGLSTQPPGSCRPRRSASKGSLPSHHQQRSPVLMLCRLKPHLVYLLVSLLSPLS